MSKLRIKPVSAAIGAALLASSIAPQLHAEVNPFSATPLSAGYDVVNAGKEGKCGEGKCGGDDKAEEGKCGEGKCGEGKCGGDAKSEEGKCGEGKCGGK